MDPGNKSDYRRVQIDRKPSCQPPPTLGKAGNNSVCNAVVLKRFPAALLQLADRLCSADGESLHALNDINFVFKDQKYKYEVGMNAR